MDKKENLGNIKNWDFITKLILGVSVGVIIFSFLSPFIFTAPSFLPSLNFTETGQIGDTLGGILNPFIALAGVLLTFLAFYMQIKANQIQITQFNKGLKREKEVRDFLETKDHFNKISLLKVDLETIKNDIKTKAEALKTYYDEEKISPYDSSILMRTPSKNYSRILEIDRLSIYNGFSMFLSHRKNWIKDFSNLYNVLDFLPEFFQSIYSKYDLHSKEKYQMKMEVRNSLVKLMDELSKLINDYLEENAYENYLKFPASKLANETIFKYYDVINESFDEEKNFVKETDFAKLDNDVLVPFIEKVIQFRKKPEGYDRRLEPLVELISNIRKQINLIKQKSLEFASMVENEHSSLMIDGNDKSYFTILNEIHAILDEELEKITIIEIVD